MSKEQLRQQLEGVKSAYESDYSKLIDESLAQGFGGLKKRIKGMDIQTEDKKPVSAPPRVAKYSAIDIADRATTTYKEKIRPEVEKPDASPAPSTHATRTSMQAMAKTLAGIRTSGNAGKSTQQTTQGNGDLGQYTSPANNNDGDLGNNTAYGQYYSLTTSMSLEEYERHINEKFVGSDEEEATPLVCGVCASDPCECVTEEQEDPIEELQERLLELDDTAWQSIDIVMRQYAEELEVTPKELHRHFKHEVGMIPDEWLRENREVQLCGWMPLDEAHAINKVGMVYDVSCMWRGMTMRFKFFWPETTLCSKDQCQACCEMLYPGSRLLAHYPSMSEPNMNNHMVVVPPIKENFEFVTEDSWMELDEETNETFHNICEEVGEPVVAPSETEDGMIQVVVESHDTGEMIEIVFENKSGDSSLHDWFNKSKSSDGKKGWVQLGGKFAGKPCARQPGQTSTPKCGSSKMKRNLNKKEEEKAFRRKNREDGNQPNKSGGAKPTNVKTEEYVDEACWKGYTQKGMKTMFGKEYPNCVKKTKTKKEEVEYVDEASGMDGMTQKGGHKRSTESGAGLTQKGVEKYRRQNPGSKLKTAVTTPPSKLKPGSKAAGRRKSFCARSRGWNGERGKAARRRWNC